MLIYYANETSAAAAGSENYRALLALLRTAQDPLAAALADSISQEAVDFPTWVRRDIEALQLATQRLQVDLAAFTNDMALRGEYLVRRAGSASAERRAFFFPTASDDPILATSPLARPAALRMALTAVGASYPAGSVDAVVVPDTWNELFTAGPDLSVSAALCPPAAPRPEGAPAPSGASCS